MAQRKSSPPTRSTGRSTGSAGSAKSGVAKSTAAKSGGRPAGSRPTTPAGRAGGTPPRKPGKSIVNQKQRPWGLIAACVAVVLFAGAIVTAVVLTRKGSSTKAGGDGTTTVSQGGQKVDTSNAYAQPALPAAMAIKGVTYRVEAMHDHVGGVVKYDESPPIGGDHSPVWADCTGKVYTHQLANENAVHALEHGAVWVTYNPDKLSKSQIAILAKDVEAKDRALLTPYAGLRTPVSLQAWGYQLFLNSPTDPRVNQFISTLSGNVKTWPEQGATCSDPEFDADKSHPNQPFEG